MEPAHEVPETGPEDAPTIKAILWPRGSMFEGKRVNLAEHTLPDNAVIIDLTPSAIEEMIGEYAARPEPFEQEAARSLRAVVSEFVERDHVDAPQPAGLMTFLDHMGLLTEPAAAALSNSTDAQRDSVNADIRAEFFSLTEFAAMLNIVVALPIPIGIMRNAFEAAATIKGEEGSSP